MKRIAAPFMYSMAFARDEHGAVTVDWVVGAAAGVALAIAIANTVGDATHDTSDVIAERLVTQGIKTY